ncbi:MAG TPA: SDR family oxidoreductase [Jatrophihabitans sp.]|jgi:nucleoside-diphosphate-sugar epimerase|uniref:SDR family oxidoreductase n=1 Tax=Jatrophihabitans sp. TaxID=1932789 RepID=UPI002E0CFFC4|nr:SDR family oxidoreductase [Jatrophihabitans sp.]
MRVFVTGASGWIGSGVVPELLAAGHRVLGLARSDNSAAALERAGADVHRGSIDDPHSLHAGALATDGVIHLAYNHDFSDMAGAARTDRRAIDTFGTALAGSERPLLIASGTLGLAVGRPGTEDDRPTDGVHPRVANAAAAVALAERGVRTVVVRFAPTVHGPGDHGFLARIVDIARTTGVSGYIGDGANRWPAVHRDDAAALVRLGLEQAPAGSVLHAVADEGVPIRGVAEVIGRHLDLPVVSIAPEDAPGHFDWLAAFLGADVPASNTITRRLTGWTPTRAGLLADLDAGHYFRAGRESGRLRS